MRDNYTLPYAPVTGPATKCVTVTPSDTQEIDATKGILVITGGDVTVVCTDDTAPQTFPAVPAYSLLPLRVKIVKATGTTSTNIKALY